MKNNETKFVAVFNGRGDYIKFTASAEEMKGTEDLDEMMIVSASSHDSASAEFCKNLGLNANEISVESVADFIAVQNESNEEA